MRWRRRPCSLPVFSRSSAVEPQLARQAAVMREHRVLAEPLAEMMRDALGEPPRVDEDERRPMLAG